MFFGFQLTCGMMLLYYGYTVMKNPRVWGDQGRRSIKAEHFTEYAKQNGLFFMKAGFVICIIAALDALGWLDGLLYVLLYVFGLAFAFYPLSRWCKEMRATPGPGATRKARRSASATCARSWSPARRTAHPTTLRTNE